MASSETAHAAWERGLGLSVWVLLSLMDQKKIEEHFVASREEDPPRIVFV